MCRNIKPLFNFDPEVTDADVRASALQYVRKVSGYTRPSKANQAAFEEAVERVAAATAELLERLVTDAPPRSRELEIERARERAARRYGAEAPAARGRGEAHVHAHGPGGAHTHTHSDGAHSHAH